MKKMIFALLCAMGLCGLNANTSDDYVDLGLQSGTLWATENVDGFMSLTSALEQFGSKIPSQAQWKELKNSCLWFWNGSGFTIIGPSGKSIELPAAGTDKRGVPQNVGKVGSYWSSTTFQTLNEDGTVKEESGWVIHFRGISEYSPNYGHNTYYNENITIDICPSTYSSRKPYSIRLIK